MSDTESIPQQEARAYFDARASEWQARASVSDVYSVISARRQLTLAIAQQLQCGRKGPLRALDVGCGSGELTAALVSRGWDVWAVDFAPEMIARASACPGLGPRGAHFLCGTIFDVPLEGRFDLLAANGFVEYLAGDEVSRFFSLARERLAPRGALVCAVRNRLFNLFSLNAYTRREQALGTIPRLVEEALLVSEAEGWSAVRDRLPGTRLPSPDHSPPSDIRVKQRAQYTPGEMGAWLAEHGLRIREMRALHPHAIPPSLGKERPDLHRELAGTLQSLPEGALRLLPFSSSFFLVAEPS